jgi:predicted nucleotidyltransferase
MVSGRDNKPNGINPSLTLDKAKRLGRKFVRELQKEFGIRFIYYFIGSIAKGKYQQGKSDIDMVILPDQSCDYGKIAIRMVAKMEEYKKYGTVFKKGRDISLIDPIIFFNTDAIHTLRAEYHKRRKEEGGKANDRNNKGSKAIGKAKAERTE